MVQKRVRPLRMKRDEGRKSRNETMEENPLLRLWIMKYGKKAGGEW